MHCLIVGGLLSRLHELLLLGVITNVLRANGILSERTLPCRRPNSSSVEPDPSATAPHYRAHERIGGDSFALT
jgi:hypothetical protein